MVAKWIVDILAQQIYIEGPRTPEAEIVSALKDEGPLVHSAGVST